MYEITNNRINLHDTNVCNVIPKKFLSTQHHHYQLIQILCLIINYPSTKKKKKNNSVRSNKNKYQQSIKV